MSEARSPVEIEQIAELRQQHIGRLLLRAHRDFSLRSVEKLRARGHAGLSLAHTGLIAHLDLDGTRITTLAERVGVTKQAVGHLVQDLEQKGYIERSTDPSDRRATIVRFTEAGWQFLRDAHVVKREIEAEYTAILGTEQMQELRSALTLLLEHDAPAQREAGRANADPSNSPF
jgi:DNA-binding MarR family transcriptional regulator